MFELFLTTLKNSGRRYQTGLVKSIEPDVKQKLKKYLGWYEEFSGLAEVRKVQDKVVDTQNKFGVIQEERRELSKKLMQCQDRLKVLHSEIEKTTRGERRFLTLVEEECNIIGEESQLKKKCEILDREEKDIFNLLTNYVNESHEKERNYANRTKYWSLIGSVFGTCLGLIGSTLNDRRKMREHRNHVDNIAKRVDNSVLSIENALKSVQIQIESFSYNAGKNNKLLESEYYNSKFKIIKEKLKKGFSNENDNYTNTTVATVATGAIIFTTGMAYLLLKN